jgi:hypothetical protein
MQAFRLPAAALMAIAVAACVTPVTTNRSALPQEALDARTAWENGTKAIVEIWQAEEAQYAAALAAQLKCSVEDLPRQQIADATKVDAAHGQVIAAFEDLGHAKYVAYGADPRVINQKIRQYYKDLKVTLPDGVSRTVEDVTTAGRTMSVFYLAALKDAVLNGRDLTHDAQLQKIKTDYVAGRKAVAAAIDAYLAQPKPAS